MRSPGFKTVLAAFAVSRIIAFGAVYWGAAHSVDPPPQDAIWHRAPASVHPAIDPWRRWDALWFLNVAREGYWFRPDAQSNVTLFPALPRLLKLGRALGGGGEWPVLILNNVAFFLALRSLHRQAGVHYGEPAAGRACWALALFPTSFVLSGLYAESICLLFTLWAFEAVGTGRPAAGGVAGAAAALSRFTGVTAFPALLLENGAWKDWRKAAPLLLIPAALAGHFLYLAVLTGRPLVYFDAQVRWGKQIAWPFYGVVYELTLSGPRFIPWFNAGTLLAFCGLAAAGFGRLRPSHAAYLAIGVAVPLCQSNLVGVPRYMLVLFPAFMLVGKFCRNRIAFWALMAASAALLARVATEFTAWRYSL